MLKIKEEVDLEHIGFFKEQGDTIWNDDWNLNVDMFTRRIGFPLIHDDTSFDRLYDLIQAGLVEKVEG